MGVWTCSRRLYDHRPGQSVLPGSRAAARARAFRTAHHRPTRRYRPANPAHLRSLITSLHASGRMGATSGTAIAQAGRVRMPQACQQFMMERDGAAGSPPTRPEPIPWKAWQESLRRFGMLLGLEDIERARARIDGRVHVTPMMSSMTIGDELGVRLHLKAELFQKTGSFKPRGVLSKLLSMDPAVRSRGLVSLSAGNHAAALAYGATAVGARATIVMPAAAMRSKVEATRRYGGEVVQTEGSLLEACLALQQERDLTLVHPFDDLAVMAGQGTVGLEILEQVPAVGIVVVPVGGGGLISGIAAAVKLQHPSVRVVGVEPEGADAMSRSLEQGAPAHLDKVDTIADGLAPPFAGEHTFRHVQS